MEQPLIESGLLAILVAGLICPFLAKRIELNLKGSGFCQQNFGLEGEKVSIWS